MSFVRGVFAVAIGVLIVLLVIFGIQAFYPMPERGDFPGWEQLRQQMATYHNIVFLIVLPLGAVLAVGGTFFRRRLVIFGAGLILGGMGTMIFAIVPSELDSVLRFTGIAVALAVLILVGFKVLPTVRKD